MKTSNKIVLGIFVGPLLLLTLLQVTLYAKYKSGHYVSMQSVQEDRFIHVPLTNISHIAVYGLNNFKIMPSDNLKLEIEKEEISHLHYIVKGDSLIIHGDTLLTRSNGDKQTERSYQDVNLYLPMAAATILADNAEVTLLGSKDSVKARSYYFSIVNDASLKVDQNGEETKPVYFKGLTIKASHSSGIELTAQTRVMDLELTMIESAFTDNGASIEKLAVDADKVSNITLKGDNLRKVNAVKQP